MSKIAIISLSGGMDSTSLLMHLLARGYDVKALTFDYGQKHVLEIERAKANIVYLETKGIEVKHKVINLVSAMDVFYSSLISKDYNVPEGHYEQENMKETVVPNRNMIFTSIILGYAQSIVNKHGQPVTVSLGVHSGDHAIYPDCREIFFTKLFGAFKVGNWNSEKVSLYLPYLKGDKYTILKDAKESIEKLGLEFKLVFRNTNTSYSPDKEGRSSGKTGADIERILAFHKLGVEDPVPYTESWEDVLFNAKKVEADHEENLTSTSMDH